MMRPRFQAINLRCMVFVFSLVAFTTGMAVAAEVGVTKDKIKLGIMTDLSGPAASTLIPYYKGIKDYFSVLNEKGGVNGRKIDLIAEDDKYTVDLTLANFKKLATSEKVFAIFGVSGADQLSVLFPLIEEQKIPVFGPTFTNQPQLKPFRPHIFSMLTTYKDQGAVILDYALEQLKGKGKTPRVGLLALDVVSGHEFIRDMKEILKARGIDLVAEAMCKMASTDLTPQVQQFKAADANHIIFFAHVPSATIFMRDTAKYGLDVGVTATSGAVSAAIYEGAGEAAKGYVSAHAVNPSYFDGAGLEELREAAKKYGSEKESGHAFYVYGWLNALVFSEGLKLAGSDLTRDKLIKALETIQNFDTRGLSGPVTFGPNDHYGLSFVRLFGYDYGAKRLKAVTEWRSPSGTK